MSKNFRRKVVSRTRVGFPRWYFGLSCGHSITIDHPSEREKGFKTMACYKCASGECGNHNWQETDAGATCKVCGLVG